MKQKKIVTTFCLFACLVTKVYGHKIYDQSNLQECFDNKEFVGLNGQCNDLFHLYASSTKINSTNNSELKISLFNLYLLGSGKTKFKDLKVVATILNQWDIIGAVEILPALSKNALTNNRIRKSFNNKLLTLKQAQKAYRKPGYIRLLTTLRKMFPTEGWSLILSPYRQSRTGELVGYYFKSKRTSLTETKYCNKRLYYLKAKKAVVSWKRNGELITRKPVYPNDKLLACTPIFKSSIEDKISRLPLISSFKKNDSTITLISTHTRFMAPFEKKNKCSSKCQMIMKEMLDSSFHPEGKEVPPLSYREIRTIIKHIETGFPITEEMMQNPSVVSALSLDLSLLKDRFYYQVSARTIARFYELDHLSKLVKYLSEHGNSKVMLMGDFNLSTANKRKAKFDYWNKIKKNIDELDTLVLITEPTTVGRAYGRVNDYDHFIYNQKALPECAQDSAKAFNFLDKFEFIDNNLDYSLLAKYLVKNPIYDFDKAKEEYIDFINTLYKVRRVGPTDTLVPISQKERDQWLEWFQTRLIDSQTRERYTYRIFKEVISDHLPISISCYF